MHINVGISKKQDEAEIGFRSGNIFVRMPSRVGVRAGDESIVIPVPASLSIETKESEPYLIARSVGISAGILEIKLAHDEVEPVSKLLAQSLRNAMQKRGWKFKILLSAAFVAAAFASAYVVSSISGRISGGSSTTTQRTTFSRTSQDEQLAAMMASQAAQQANLNAMLQQLGAGSSGGQGGNEQMQSALRALGFGAGNQGTVPATNAAPPNGLFPSSPAQAQAPSGSTPPPGLFPSTR